MSQTCSYCSSLKMGIPGDNVCSVHGAALHPNSSGNSFYIKSKKLTSGEHVSRLTIRGVLDGYQHYSVGNKRYRLTPDNYLVVNKGEKYSSEINAEAPTESMIVAFGDQTMSRAARVFIASEEQMLDNPFESNASDMMGLSLNGAYRQTSDISAALAQLKEAILLGNKETGYFENAHYALMLLLIQNHLGMLKEVDVLKDIRKETRIELHRRIRIAQDYMDSCFTQKLTLQEIASHAALSTCHFLRSFKQLHQVTPYEYLTRTRLKHAKYLLLNADMDIQAVTNACGFDNHSSFSRLFRKRFQVTPKQYKRSSAHLAISA